MALLGNELVGPLAEDLGEARARTDGAEQLCDLAVGGLGGGVALLALGSGEGEQALASAWVLSVALAVSGPSAGGTPNEFVVRVAEEG